MLTGLGIAILVILIVLQSLHWFTRHDRTMALPSVTGKSSAEAIALLEAASFEVVIQDSI